MGSVKIYKEQIDDECREMLDDDNILHILTHKATCVFYLGDMKAFLDKYIPDLMEDMECDPKNLRDIFYGVSKIISRYMCKKIKYPLEKNARDERIAKIPNSKASKEDRLEFMRKNAKTLMLSLGRKYNKGDIKANLYGISNEAFNLTNTLSDLIENSETYAYKDVKNIKNSRYSLSNPTVNDLKKELRLCLDKVTIPKKENRIEYLIEELEKVLKNI